MLPALPENIQRIMTAFPCNLYKYLKVTRGNAGSLKNLLVPFIGFTIYRIIYYLYSCRCTFNLLDVESLDFERFVRTPDT